jgi:hypothetical protein
MENEQENLNTESNDIAGNRVDGPVGNTATKPGLASTGVGIPGGPPTSAAASPAGNPSVGKAAASASSEALADSETSMGEGSVEHDSQPQENKEANPADLKPRDVYGGNFGNSTQGSYRDQDRRENQDSDPNRGEFGVQNPRGTTHGGFGNQFREGITEHQGPADAQYYGEGNVNPNSGDHNSYRTYDGRDERPDSRTQYGFERGTNAANTSGQAAGTGQTRGERFDGPNGDNRNQPDRADRNVAYQNDNGSATGPDNGYASDYGHTSLRGDAAASVDATRRTSATDADRRNQSEDYLPTPGDADSQGRKEQHPGYSTNSPEMADQRGERPLSSQGYGDRGRDEPRRSPDFQTGDDRDGYVQSSQGNAAQGTGSRGGSYNDAYDDSQPGSKAGSPAKGEERSEDRAQNYGQAARAENRSGDANDADHGAPRRNAGRDGEADE